MVRRFDLVFLATLTSTILTSTLFAPASLIARELPIVGSEPDEDSLGTMEEDEEASIEALREDLQATGMELRENLENGLSLGIGMGLPWQAVRLEWHHKLSRELWISANYGFGTTDFSGTTAGQDYKLGVDTQQIAASLRYYFTESMPVFIQPYLGYGIWSGRIKASGIDVNDSEQVLDNISTTFNAQGLTAAVGLGAAALLESGFYLEYTFVGFSMSKLFSETLARNRDRATGLLEDTLESPLGFGFLNLTAGYFF